ncbi:hypothetical protein ABIE21_001080 [Conyzicola nivalis]|uniref:Uncharacterized protein n=1 Tax=Conyzicola nivalis TaxID=1477021 RepID=A0ABV2QKS8_9MICO
MGAAKRYAHVVDRRMSDSIAQRVMESGPPVSLGSEELALDRVPLTRTPKPLRVHVWVRYPAGSLQVDAEAVAWTARAVAVRWKSGDAVHKAWVSASAVEGDRE